MILSKGMGRLAVALLCITVLPACATTGTPTLDARLVRPGKPSIDYGDVPAGPPGISKTRRPPTRPAGVPHSPVLKSSGLTVEGTDQRLAAALLIEAATPSADTHLAVAAEYRRLGIMDAAERRIERAIRRDPRRADAHEALARLWRDSGVPGRALGPAYRAVAAAPESARAANTLGTVFAALDDWSAAAAQFERVAAMSDGASWALSNQCYAGFREGRLSEARRVCERATERSPDFSAAHNNLGLVLAALGEIRSAREQFELAGGTAAAEYNIGIVYEANADHARAALAFERAIRARPDFVDAKRRARHSRERAGR